MKLPWDKQYLKISFHVVVTLLVIYASALLLKNAPAAVGKIEVFAETLTDILSPLIIAVIFSYIASPAVDKLQGFFMSKKVKKGRFEKRTAGTALLYLILFGLVCLILFFAVTGIGEADTALIKQKMMSSAEGFAGTLQKMNDKLAALGIERINIFDSMMDFGRGILKRISEYFAEKLSTIGTFAADLAVGLTVSFYLLMEKDKILYYGRDIIKTVMPKHYRGMLNTLSKANEIFSGYIRGQLTDAFVMAALISVGLFVIGIDYPFIIGIISGFSNLIPYVGALSAFVLAVSVALIGGTPIKALYAAVVIILLQQLDSAVIIPKVVGKKVSLHPVLVILSLSFFGRIFGLWGMVFAVPVTSLMKMTVSDIYLRRRNKLKNLEI